MQGSVCVNWEGSCAPEPAERLQADEAARRYEEQSRAEGSGQQAAPRFEAQDLESLTGSYNTVCCIDVLIHYPPVRPDDLSTVLQ